MSVNWCCALFVVLAAFAANVNAASRPTPVYRALQLLLDRQDEAAKVVIETAVLPPARTIGACRGENAELRDLGGRLFLGQYQDLRARGMQESRTLRETAEAYAAAAVWEDPYELTYWLDYVDVALTTRTDDQLQDLAVKNRLQYTRLGPYTLRVTDALESRMVMLAALRYKRGFVIDADQVLSLYLDGPAGGSRCIAAGVLADIRQSMDHRHRARKILEDNLEFCSGAGRQAFAAKLLSLNSDRRSPMAPVNAADENEPALEAYQLTVTGRGYQPLDVANRVLRDPYQLDAWHLLWSATGRSWKAQKLYDRVMDRVWLRAGSARVPAIVTAKAFREIDRAEFETARDRLQALADRQECDPQCLVALVLLDLSLGSREQTSGLLRDAERLGPELTACLDRRLFTPCFNDRADCIESLIVCRDATEFVFDVWEEGRTRRPDATRDVDRALKILRARVEDDERMVREIEQRLRAEIRAGDEAAERRARMIDSRIDMLVDLHIRPIEEDLRRLHRTDDEIRREIDEKSDSLRADLGQRIESLALENAKAYQRLQQESLTEQEAVRLITRHVANAQALDAFRGEILALLEKQKSKMMEALMAQLAEATKGLANAPDSAAQWRILTSAQEPLSRRIKAAKYFIELVVDFSIAPHKGKWQPALGLKPGGLLQILADILQHFEERRPTP